MGQELEKEIEKIIETLNPDEKIILPYLKEKTLTKISEKSSLDKTKVLRALQYLSNKGVLQLETKKEVIVDLDENGVVYLKNGLPERQLLNLKAVLEQKIPEKLRKNLQYIDLRFGNKVYYKFID